jgi:hypothetical protein
MTERNINSSGVDEFKREYRVRYRVVIDLMMTRDDAANWLCDDEDALAVYIEQTTEIPCKLVSFDVVQGDEKA